MASALLDRLLHDVIVIQIEGANYGLRAHADLISASTYPPLVKLAVKRIRGHTANFRTPDIDQIRTSHSGPKNTSFRSVPG